MAGYTRQSSYSDGDTITAAHTNDEFNQLEAAFNATTGHDHSGAGEGGPIASLAAHGITFGAGTTGTDITVTWDGETNDGVLKWMEDEDYFEFSDDILMATTEKLQFRDTALYINSSADGQLDLVADTEIQLTATTVDLNGNLDVSGTFTLASTALSSTAAELNLLDGSSAGTIVNSKALIYGSSGEVNATTLQIAGTSINSTAAELNLMDGGTSAGTTAVAGTDGIVTNDGGTMRQTTVDTFDTYLAQTTKTLTNKTLTTPVIAEIDSGADITLDATADIILDAGGANIIFKDDGTSILDIANNSSDVELTVSVADKNFAIKGTDDASAITALDIDMALAGKATFNGDVVVGGDLTITGDDLIMGTNTAGHILVADGTNFNPVAVTSLSEISTVANDDVFLAVDTSGGGLKKIARSAIVSGLATSGAISNVVEDTTPQLGGSLDVNGEDIVSTSNGNITLTPNGTGVVRIDGSNGIDMESGAISIKNAGSESYIRFYCETSNSHYTQLQASPHSAYSGNVTVVLPASADTLVGRATTDTLTNKTLTSPVLNTATVGTSIVPSSADGASLGTASAEFSDLFLADGGIIKLGNDQEVTLTHVADTGVLLNSTNQLQFGDSGTYIHQSADGVLDLVSDTEIELNATTLDINANTENSGHLQIGDYLWQNADGDDVFFGLNFEVQIRHLHNKGLRLSNNDATNANTAYFVLNNLDTSISTDQVLGSLEFQASAESDGSDAILTAAFVRGVAEGAFSTSSNATKLSFGTGSSEAASEKMSLSSGGNLTVSGTYTGGGLMTTGGNIVIPNAGNIGSASDTDALAISSGGVVNFTQQPTVASAAVKVAGKETIWIPAAAMYPETTNGCSDLTQVELANGPELKCLDFATGSDEHAQFTIAFPKSWNEGTVTFKAYFTVTGTNTGTTAWGLAGGSFSDNGDLNTAFGTTVVATAKAHSGTSNDLDVTAESGAVTIAGSPAAEDLCFFQVMRDVSADDQSGDSRLLGIKLFFTTDAANDA